MTYRHISIVLCIGLFCGASFAFASDEKAPETIGEFVLQTPALTSRPLVNYCVLAQPGLSDALNGEYESFIRKITEAGKPLAERLSSDQNFASPVSPEMRAQVERVGEAMLAQVKKGDSSTYCNNIIQRMRDATVEQLRAQINQAYDGYRQLTREIGASDSGAP